MNTLVVQKYGGTSVGSIELIKKVAERIARMRKTGLDIIVVVSAMAGQTDKLLDMAQQINPNAKHREIDLLLSSGERISSALLTIALDNIGCPSISMTGRQIGLLTDNSHTRARIKEIDTERARRILKKKHVIVVAGFQGINEHGDVTTLGSRWVRHFGCSSSCSSKCRTVRNLYRCRWSLYRRSKCCSRRTENGSCFL